MSDRAASVEVEGILRLPHGRGSLRLENYDDAGPNDPNLFLDGPSGGTVWAAATGETLDKWVSIRLHEGRILATSFRGYLCELSPADGSIVSTTFVK